MVMGNQDLGDANLKLGTDGKPLESGLSKAKLATGAAMAAMGAAVTAFAITSIKSFTQTGDEIQKMALRTGFSTEALSELRFAAEQSGTSLQGFENGTRRMASTLEDAKDGLSTAVLALDKLGLTTEQFQGLGAEESFFIFASAIGEVGNSLEQSALAQDIFGRSGNQLLPLIKEGADGMAALRQEARDLGIVFDQEAADAAAQFTDDMNSLSKSFDAVKFTVAESLLPVLTPLVEGLTEGAKAVKDWAERNPGLARTLTVVGVGLGLIAAGVGTLLVVVPLLTIAVATLGVTLSIALAGIPTLIAAIIGGVTLLVLKWDEVVEFMKGAGGWILAAFGPIGLAAKLVIDNWELMLSTLRRGFNGIVGLVNGVVRALNNLIGAYNAVATFLKQDTIPKVEFEMSRWEEKIVEVADTYEFMGNVAEESFERSGVASARVAEQVSDDWRKVYDEVGAASEDAATGMAADFRLMEDEAGAAFAGFSSKALLAFAELRKARAEDLADFLAAQAAKAVGQFGGSTNPSGFGVPDENGVINLFPSIPALDAFFARKGSRNNPGTPFPGPGDDQDRGDISVSVSMNGRAVGQATAETAISTGGALPSE